MRGLDPEVWGAAPMYRGVEGAASKVQQFGGAAHKLQCLAGVAATMQGCARWRKAISLEFGARLLLSCKRGYRSQRLKHQKELINKKCKIESYKKDCAA